MVVWWCQQREEGKRTRDRDQERKIVKRIKFSHDRRNWCVCVWVGGKPCSLALCVVEFGDNDADDGIYVQHISKGRRETSRSVSTT